MSVVPLYIMYMATVLCEDRVLDGPASGEKGSKGGPYVLQSSHANHDSRTHLDVRLPTRSFRFFELLT